MNKNCFFFINHKSKSLIFEFSNIESRLHQCLHLSLRRPVYPSFGLPVLFLTSRIFEHGGLFRKSANRY